MLKNPQDRRARRTARLIKETMFSFLESKAMHEISVSEICKTCQINRATFYDHYRDVFDLVQDMEKDMLLALQELMEAVSPEETEAEHVSRLFFAFLAEHKQKIRLLLNNERSREFCARLDELIMPFFEKKVRQNYRIPDGMGLELQRVMQFAAAGYYRFFMRALAESGINVYGEAEMCAKLSDACLSACFERIQ